MATTLSTLEKLRVLEMAAETGRVFKSVKSTLSGTSKESNASMAPLQNSVLLTDLNKRKTAHITPVK
jgi:hypothetical protein